MSDKHDGGPAFPIDQSDSCEYTNVRGGMSLRDYFAGQALGVVYQVNAALQIHDPKESALEAYRFADALLKVRGIKP